MSDLIDVFHRPMGDPNGRWLRLTCASVEAAESLADMLQTQHDRDVSVVARDAQPKGKTPCKNPRASATSTPAKPVRPHRNP